MEKELESINKTCLPKVETTQNISKIQASICKEIKCFHLIQSLCLATIIRSEIYDLIELFLKTWKDPRQRTSVVLQVKMLSGTITSFKSKFFKFLNIISSFLRSRNWIMSISNGNWVEKINEFSLGKLNSEKTQAALRKISL